MEELPEHRVEIHVTDTSIFRGCRLRWAWTSSLRHNLESASPPKALWLGTGVHYALEKYYGDGLHPAEVFEAWAHTEVGRIKDEWPHMMGDMPSFDDDIHLGVGMLAHYYNWAQKNDDFEVVSVEESFTIPDFLPPRVAYIGEDTGVVVGTWDYEPLKGTEALKKVMLHIDLAGQGDMVIQDREGDYWVWENKTTAQIRDMSRLILEEQPGVYHAAMEAKLGVKISGVRFNFLRKKLPAIPEELKTGGLTKRQNIDTTYETYMTALRAKNLDPRNYQEVLDRLQDKGNTFFHREDVVRSNSELRILIDRLKRVAEDMVDPDLRIYPSPDMFKCPMCPMQGPCIALADGSDWRYILDSQYRKRKPRSERTDIFEDVDVLAEPGFV